MEYWEDILSNQLNFNSSIVETFRSEHLTTPFDWCQLTRAELKEFGLKTGDCIRFGNFLKNQTQFGEPEVIDLESYTIGEPDLEDEDDEKMDEIAAAAKIKVSLPNGRDLISVLISSQKPIRYKELTNAIKILNICCHIVKFKTRKNIAQFELIKKHYENLKPYFNRLKDILRINAVHKIRIKPCRENNDCSNCSCYFFHDDGLNRSGLKIYKSIIYCRFGSRCKNLSCRFEHFPARKNYRNNVNQDEDFFDIFLEANRKSPKMIDGFCFTFAVMGKCTKSNCPYRHIGAEKIICPEFKIAGECKRSRCLFAHGLSDNIFDLTEDSIILKNARKKLNAEQKNLNDENLRKLKEDNAKLSAELKEQIECVNIMEKEMKKVLKGNAKKQKKKKDYYYWKDRKVKKLKN